MTIVGKRRTSDSSARPLSNPEIDFIPPAEFSIDSWSTPHERRMHQNGVHVFRGFNLGIDFAGAPWTEVPWRFAIAGNPSVSGPGTDATTDVTKARGR